MAQKYRKIDPRIWRDEKFAGLTPDEKLVSLYCLTAQVNRCGIFVFSPAMAAEELGTSPQTFRERFGRVVKALRWRWDSDRRVLYFPRWWRYNSPENANVLKGCLADLAELPETALLAEFYANLADLPESLHETFRKRSGNVTPNPPETIGNSGTGTGTGTGLRPSDACPEPGETPASGPTPGGDTSPIVLTYPCVGTGPAEWPLRESKVAEYAEAFPAVDVRAECRKALQWVRDNPKNRKTADGMARFLNNWLKREQNAAQQLLPETRNGLRGHRPGVRPDTRIEPPPGAERKRPILAGVPTPTPADPGPAAPAGEGAGDRGG